MKYSKILLFTFCILLFAPQLFAQSDSTAFKPSGKIIARAFVDYSTGLSSNTNEDTGFDITRAFLGYSYQITPTLRAQVIVDGASGKDDKGNLQVYLRNAFVEWKDYGFTISAGEIGMLASNLQESYWKHRYVFKSFQDLNKISNSVDIGITAEYDFNNILSADISIMNGEGYKTVKKDDSNKYALGLTISPIKNFVLRAYGDVYIESEKLRQALPEDITEAEYKNQYTVALFGGYQDKNISGGIEYTRSYNRGFIENKDIYGYSAFSSVKVAPKWRAYARYDHASSDSPTNFTSPWSSNDGQLIIGGIEFQPIKQLKISPNFRNLNPDRSKSEQYLFINLEFNL